MRAALTTAPITSDFPPSQDGVPQRQTSLTNQTNPNMVNAHQPASAAHSLQRKRKPGRSMSTHCSHTLQSLSRSPWHCWCYTTDLTAHEEQRSAGADKQLSSCCCIHWYCKTQKNQEASLLSSHSLTTWHRNSFLVTVPVCLACSWKQREIPSEIGWQSMVTRTGACRLCMHHQFAMAGPSKTGSSARSEDE